jgi:CRISPR-associated endoribonuclease Cas6
MPQTHAPPDAPPKLVALAQNAAPPPTLASAGANPHTVKQEMIPLDLPVTRLRITLEAREDVHLPAFAGSKLEGAFGRTLYDLSCTRTDLQTCHACPLRAVCPYAALYAPSRPTSLPVASLEAPPRPLVFHTAFEHERTIPKDGTLEYGLSLIGRATQHLPYVIATIRSMGEAGIGRTRGRYALRDAHSEHPYSDQRSLISSGEHPTVNLKPIILNASDLPALPGDTIRLEWQSFVHIRAGDAMAETLHFPVLVRALQRRISNLEQLYGGAISAGADYGHLPQLAREVQTITHQVRSVRQARSGKGRAPVMMHGLIGSVTYHGDLEPFTNLLRYGELLGVGKWAGFGAGQYRIGTAQAGGEVR